MVYCDLCCSSLIWVEFPRSDAGFGLGVISVAGRTQAALRISLSSD